MGKKTSEAAALDARSYKLRYATPAREKTIKSPCLMALPGVATRHLLLRRKKESR